MRIYKNDIIKASAISTGADRGVLLCSITDSGFTSIAGYFIVRFVPCVDSMARKMYVNTKSYDIKNDNQRVLFH